MSDRFFCGGGEHGETFFGGRGLVFEAGEFPEGGYVAAVVAGIVDRSFGEEGAAGQAFGRRGAEAGMGQETAKGFGADFAVADVIVAIDAAAERNFGVVNVEDRNVFEPDDAIGELERGDQAGFALDVVAGGEEMRGIQAGADLQALQRVEHLAEFFEARAEGGAHARGVFEQDANRAGRQIFGGLLDGIDREAQGLVGLAFAARAGMHDYEVGAEGHAANEFVVKGLDGASAQHGLLGGEVDQIIGVNDQRAEGEFLAAGAESGGFDFRDTSGPAGPHARTGRENLQGVAAEFLRGFESVGVAAGNRGVDADAQTAVHPGGWSGFRLRFGAIFVFRIEFDDGGEGLFRHSQ